VCGILAEWRRDGAAVDQPCARRRLDAMAHRGPDGVGMVGWSAAGGLRRLPAKGPHSVILGHRRLAIIDLSDGGAQPMVSPDGAVALTFNGEIYNYIELREELRCRHGRCFRSGSDTEVLVAAWQTWGEAALDRLDGMFAFALLDTRARRLTLARDPFGIKPLHYTFDEGALRVASEIQPLILGTTPRADTSRLFDYLRWGAVDEGEATLFEGVRQLGPGELMVADLGANTIERRAYWTPVARPRRHDGSPGAADLRAAFFTAVERHARADVPVAATLSGGLDSSSICSALRALNPGEPIRAFSYVASGAHSEERWIDILARDKDLCVDKVSIHEDEVLEDLSLLIRAQEQPFGSGSIYAQYKIFEAIRRRGYKVMLDGQGADEILGGYKSYVAFRVADLIAERRFGEAISLFHAHGRRDPASRNLIAQRLARKALPPAVARFARRIMGAGLDLPFGDTNWFASRGLDPAQAEARQLHEGLGLDEVLTRSLRSVVLPSLLRYADRNAMAFSVENRVPFLSRPLVELAGAMPREALISSDGRTKAVLRDALHDDLPPAIRDRHDKVGFRATEEAWMQARPSWTREELRACRDLPFVDPAKLGRATERLLGGDGAQGQVLFRLVVYRRWLEIFGVALD
jgi:asparagine synthase (glutamine-hydrolysing)